MKPSPTRTRLYGCLHLASVALRRMVFSRQTFVCIVMFCFVLLVVIAWNMRRERTPEQFVIHVVLPIYVTFLLPVFCLCYASASIAGEREERTLVYVLSTPIPRPLIHLSKYLASTALVLVWTIGGLAAFCVAAGSAGTAAFQRFWLIVMEATLAYCSLFHLFSVLFRRATIVALAYALVLEVLVGNMPGTFKRLTVAFYTKCLVLDASAEFGVRPTGTYDPALFLPVPAATAAAVLWGCAVGLFLCGTWFFARREYA